MGNKLHSSQIQTGISPGDIPVYSNRGTLISTGSPFDQFDVINKQYLDSVINTIPEQTNVAIDLTPLNYRIDELKSYIDTQYSNIANNTMHLNDNFNAFSTITDNRLYEIEQNYTNIMNIISEVKDYINSKTQYVYTELTSIIDTIKFNILDIEQNINNINNTLVIEKTIDELKKDCKIKVDQYCANFLNYEVVYKEKFEQAVDFMMRPDTDTTAFPLLILDTTIYNITIQEAAERIIQKRKQWLQYMTQIEQLRLTVKQNIDSAIEKEYINNLYSEFEQNIQLLTNG